MNRRLFITRLLTGLAAVPLVGELAQRSGLARKQSSSSQQCLWKGELAEPPLVFNRALDDDEIAQIYDYYQRRYGIEIHSLRSFNG